MNIDKLLEKSKKIEEEINKMFNEICDDNEISINKNTLLSVKIFMLEISRHKLTNDLKFEKKRLFKLGLLFRMIDYLMDILTLLVILCNGLVGLVFLGINVLCSIKTYKVFNKSVKDGKKCDEAISNIEDLDVIFENCHALLKGHTNYELVNPTQQLYSREVENFDLANNYIEMAMVNGMGDDIPKEVKEIMVAMLQDTLETDENDLNKLLEMAFQKEEQESLGKESAMVRILQKGEKNSKN